MQFAGPINAPNATHKHTRDFHFSDILPTDTDIQIQSDFVSVNLSSFVFAFVFCFVLLHCVWATRSLFFSLLASIAHNYYFCYFFYRCFVLLLSSPPCLWLHQCREYEIKNNKTASTVWAVAAQAEWSAQSLNSNETISYMCIAHTYFARIKCVSVLLLLLLFKSLANKQRFSILALFLFDRHLEFCLFVLSLDSLNSIVCLIILALTRVRLLTHSIARFTSLWRWRQQIQPNRTSLCLHWLNFLLCIAIATKQKRDRFISCTNVYERFLWNYR